MTQDNPTTTEIQHIVNKVRAEATRKAYTDGAYDAIMAFCRALGVPAMHISRPSLWSTPIDRVRSLEEYTDENGIEALEEMRNILSEAIEGPRAFIADDLMDGASQADTTELVMPQCKIDALALEGVIDEQS